MQEARRGRLLDPLKIVVADDDARMREFYVEVLTRMGHEVVAAAANGRELVDDCLNSNVDLVVTDIRMPDMDGIQAAHIITEHVPVPFLFVSAYYEDTEIRGAMMSYSYGYLLKPVKQEDLATSIPIAVQRFRDQEQYSPT
jgi:two-component system, response regulator PdtaR